MQHNVWCNDPNYVLPTSEGLAHVCHKIEKDLTGLPTKSYRVPINFRFDLIPALVLRRLSSIYEEGTRKYGEVAYLVKPLPDSVILNHLLNHLYLWVEGDKSEDNLAKVLWGVATLMVMEEHPNGIHDIDRFSLKVDDENRNEDVH